VKFYDQTFETLCILYLINDKLELGCISVVECLLPSGPGFTLWHNRSTDREGEGERGREGGGQTERRDKRRRERGHQITS
jgi:hypothetical protein